MIRVHAAAGRSTRIATCGRRCETVIAAYELAFADNGNHKMAARVLMDF